MSLRLRPHQTEETVFSRSKSFSWRIRHSGKGKPRRPRSMVVTGSTSTTDSGYTSEKSDVDTINGQRSRRTSVSSVASRSQYMPEKCYHCRISQSNAVTGNQGLDRPGKVRYSRCLPNEDLGMALDNIPYIDRSPYSSLRKILYGPKPETKSSKKRDSKVFPNVRASPVLTKWRPIASPFQSQREVELRDKSSMVEPRRRKALHLSLYDTPSYTELYFPYKDENGSLNQEVVKLRHNNKRLRVKRKIRSYDPSKFEKMVLSGDPEESRLKLVNTDADKMVQAAKRYSNIVEDDTKSYTAQDTYPQGFASQNMLEIFGASPQVEPRQWSTRDSGNFVPWQKRRSSTIKRNKKAEKSDGRFLTAFCDKLRPNSGRRKEMVKNPLRRERKISEDIGKAFYGGLFGKTYKQLYFLRSRLSPYSKQGEWICYGSFGCPERAETIV